MKQPVEKKKEIWYAKALQKDNAKRPSTLYRFEVLAQLANVLARIALWASETLQVNKRSYQKSSSWRRGFIAQILAGLKEEDDGHCLQTFKPFPCIMFTPDDMQLKGKHDIPLYYTGYIGSFELSRIHVDSGSALSIMPPQSHATFGDPHLTAECDPDNHLWLQRQWYETDGKDQAQMPNRRLKVKGNMLRH